VALKEIVVALAEPYRNSAITTVAGIESRGFLLGGALCPGPKVRHVTSADYRVDSALHGLVRQGELPQ
jgi:adenine phosphoribosyltransferase